MPLAIPISIAKPKPSAKAAGTGMPLLISLKTQPTEIAMIVTMVRSMPRPMTTSAIPDTQNAENGDALQQRNEIARRCELIERQAKNRKEHHCNRQDDFFLVELQSLEMQ